MAYGTRAQYTPTVQELRALVYCADLGSASRAAEALSLTQSGISRSIRTLEDRLQVRLFNRVRQRLVLTDAGRALVRDARDILARLDGTARMAMAFGGAEKVLRIAALPSFASAWVVPKLAPFLAAHPTVTIDVTSELGPVDFETNPVDAAIQRAGMARRDMNVLPLVSETLVLVAAPDFVRPGLRPDEILEYPLIHQATRPTLWQDWLAAAGVDPAQHSSGPRFQHFGMVLAAARARLGVAILPDVLATTDLETGRLVRVALPPLNTKDPYALIWPKWRQPNPTLDALGAWLSEMTA